MEVVLLAAGGQPPWWRTHGMAASLALVLPDYKLFQENKIYQVSKNFIDKAIFSPPKKADESLSL